MESLKDFKYLVGINAIEADTIVGECDEIINNLVLFAALRVGICSVGTKYPAMHFYTWDYILFYKLQ
jgi:hypothetical protein